MSSSCHVRVASLKWEPRVYLTLNNDFQMDRVVQERAMLQQLVLTPHLDELMCLPLMQESLVIHFGLMVSVPMRSKL